MIIKIEDAPNIKHIKIDINFDEDGEATIVSTPSKKSKLSEDDNPLNLADVPLNLADDFSVNKEIVEKPMIPDTDRNISVSEDMKNAEF